MRNVNVYAASSALLAKPRSKRLRGAARSLVATNVRIAFLIGLLGLVLRVIWVLSVHRDGFVVNDTLFYDIFAQNLADGKGYTDFNGSPSAAWPPGFPFVLSFAFRVFGSDPLVGELMNAVIGSASVVLLYLVALRALGRREAIFCAFAFAVFPAQIFFTDLLLSETLFVFLAIALLALVAVLPRTTGAAVGMGLVVGFAALTRGEGGLLAVVPIAVWSASLDRRTLLLRSAAILAAAAVVVVPWTLRNKSELGSYVLNSTNGGQTLWAGHNPAADGRAVYAPQSLTDRYAAMGKPAGEVALDSELKRRAINWALSHPLDELILIPSKLLYLASPDHTVFSTWLNKQESPTDAISVNKTARLGLIADIAWYTLLTFFFLSVAVYRKALWRASSPIMRGVVAWIGVSLFLYGFVLFGQFRYHIPLQPLMLLVTAPLICAVWASRRRLVAGLTNGRSS